MPGIYTATHLLLRFLLLQLCIDHAGASAVAHPVARLYIVAVTYCKSLWSPLHGEMTANTVNPD